MNALTFRCDPAAQVKRRALLLFGLSCFLWSVVSYYLPWALVGFVLIAWYFSGIRHIGKSRWIEMTLSDHLVQVRRLDADHDWVRLERRPRIWGVWVVARVPEHIMPFGMLWLSEPLLGRRLFRQVRRLCKQ